jgi:RHH-type proline utilization regulon transcriptional repressor/proline dehydrogenase/delta 1-pyrroline-5-carboxylate dehydrogenase
VAQLGRWRQGELPSAGEALPAALAARLERCLAAVDGGAPADTLRASAASYARAWREHFGCEHEPVRLLGERNVFRYRPCGRVLVRGESATAAGRLALGQVLLAAGACGVPLEISLAAGDGSGWLAAAAEGAVAVEPEAGLLSRLGDPGGERLRALVPISREARAAAHAAGVTVLDAPPLAAGRLELRAYTREQAISRTVHRYGNVMEETAT